jgi:autotransporter-associated beta strand protein
MSGSQTYNSLTANYASTIGGTASTVGIGGGTVDLGGQSNTVGSLVLTAGTLSNGTLTAGTYNLQNGTVSAALAGSSGVTKSTAGTVTLSGANTYTGNTVISDGILVLSNALALQNSALDTATSVTGNANAGVRSTVTTLTLGGLTGNKNLADVFTTTSGGYGSVTALTLNPGTGVTNTYSGAIANGATNMTLTKIGAGTQVLSGANTYNGTTTITAGTLRLGANNTIPAGSSVTINGGTLDNSGNANTIRSLTITSGSLIGSGTMTVALGGGVSLSGTGILAANLTTPGDVSVSTTDSSSTYYAIQSPSLTAKDLIVAPNSWLTAGPGSTWNLNGIDLNASGAAPRSNLRINGATVNVGGGGNSYNVMLSRGATETSTLFMDAGTLSAIRIGMGRKQGGFQNTGTGTLEWTGGTIRNYAGQDLLFNSYDTVDTTYGLQINLTGAGNKTLTADSGRTIRVGANSVNDSTGTTQNTGGAYFTGSTGTLLLDGPGTVEFYKENSYNGTIQVNAGLLRLMSGSQTYNSVTANYASTIGGTSSTVGIGGGTVDLGGQSNTVGSLVLTAGTLTNGTLTAGTYNLQNGTVSAALAGSSGVTKSTAGTVTLSGNNAYTGASTIDGGTLLVATSGSIASSSLATVNSGGLLKVNGTAGSVTVNGGGSLGGSGSVGALSLNSGGLLNPGNSPGTLTANSAIVLGNSTYNWQITSLTGTAGTNWDLLNVTTLLDMSAITGTGANKWNLVVTADGAFTGWTDNRSYEYVFAQAANLSLASGFNTDAGTDVTNLFNISTSGITSKPNPSFNSSGDFKVVVGRGANDVTTLNLMAIPEPSTGSMLGLGLAGLVVTRLFRRKGV